jgi:acyl-CoA synthetase (AMP-forming)/AMP-acid ligase II
MTTQPPASYQPLTIATGMRAAAGRTPAKVALREGNRTLDYASLVERMDRVSALVTEGLGLRPGDNVALLSPNCLEYVEIVAGASCAGVAVATLNPRLVAREIEYICDDCSARILFVHPSLEEMVRALTLDSVERIIVLGDGYEDLLAAAAISCTVLTVLAPRFVLVEPQFFWPDRLSPFHLANVTGEQARRHGDAPANVAARRLVQDLRRSALDCMTSHGATNLQIGRFYPYRSRLSATQADIIRRLRAALDPEGQMNPGVLDAD